MTNPESFKTVEAEVIEQGPLVWRDDNYKLTLTSAREVNEAEDRANDNLTSLRAEIEYATEGYSGLFLGQLPPAKAKLPWKKTDDVYWSLPELTPAYDIKPIYDFRMHYLLAKSGNIAKAAWMTIKSEHDSYFDNGYERVKQPPTIGLGFDDGRINELWLAWSPYNSTALDKLTKQPSTRVLMKEAQQSYKDIRSEKSRPHDKYDSYRPAECMLRLWFPVSNLPYLIVKNSAGFSSYHRSMSGGESTSYWQVAEALQFPFNAEGNTFSIRDKTAYRTKQYDYSKTAEKSGKSTFTRKSITRAEYMALLQDILQLIPAAPLPVSYPALSKS